MYFSCNRALHDLTDRYDGQLGKDDMRRRAHHKEHGIRQVLAVEGLCIRETTNFLGIVGLVFRQPAGCDQTGLYALKEKSCQSLEFKSS